MHIFILLKINFKILLFLFTFLIIFNICFPHEAFAMEPPKDWIIDYYGNKQYVGPDAYGYYHPPQSLYKGNQIEPKIVYDNPYNTSNNPDYQLPYNRINYNPVELDGKILDKHVCKPEQKELHLWTPGQSLRWANPVIYELDISRPVTFELDADYYEDTISTSLDSTHFDKTIEFVRNYKILVDSPSNKHDVLSNIKLGVKTTKFNIVYIYLKFQEIGRRKILWTIWEKHNNKYESYKHFKKSWDSNTSIFSNIRKDVRENIKNEVEDLLGVKKINKNLKRSVKTEIEKLLREKQPFKY